MYFEIGHGLDLPWNHTTHERKKGIYLRAINLGLSNCLKEHEEEKKEKKK
jgi:hypothetical protein